LSTLTKTTLKVLKIILYCINFQKLILLHAIDVI
jgi:hypothetical protein